VKRYKISQLNPWKRVRLRDITMAQPFNDRSNLTASRRHLQSRGERYFTLSWAIMKCPVLSSLLSDHSKYYERTDSQTGTRRGQGVTQWSLMFAWPYPWVGRTSYADAPSKTCVLQVPVPTPYQVLAINAKKTEYIDIEYCKIRRWPFHQR
jgi:hypothetical protein